MLSPFASVPSAMLLASQSRSAAAFECLQTMMSLARWIIRPRPRLSPTSPPEIMQIHEISAPLPRDDIAKAGTAAKSAPFSVVGKPHLCPWLAGSLAYHVSRPLGPE